MIYSYPRPNTVSCSTVDSNGNTLATVIADTFSAEQFILRMNGNDMAADFQNPVDKETLDSTVAVWTPVNE